MGTNWTLFQRHSHGENCYSHTQLRQFSHTYRKLSELFRRTVRTCFYLAFAPRCNYPPAYTMQGERNKTTRLSGHSTTSPITWELQCCQTCGAFGNKEDRYCSGCGMPYDNRCARCGAEIRNSKALYCAVCGDRIQQPVSKE